MNPNNWNSVIAVAGTLAGALTAGLTAFLIARMTRRAARADALRADVITAITDLAAAIADHRASMWDRGILRISGASADAIATATTAVRATRSAITAPLTRIGILAPDLQKQAQAAAAATYALRDAQDQDALDALRLASLAADKVLVAAAARVVAGLPG